MVGFVGIALALFVISDLLGTRNGWFGRQTTDIGEVRGEKIPYNVFQAEYERIVENQKLNTQTETLDPNTMEMLKEQTWNTMVQEIIVNAEYEKLGISVTPSEVADMVQGNDPHPSIKGAQQFQNQQTQQFDRNLFAQYYNSIKQDPDGKAWKMWLSFESGIQKERMNQKFNAMIKGGIFSNSLEAKELYLSKNKTIDIKFAGLNYSTIADSSVVLSDDELKKYFDKNIAKYKSKENSRKLEYVAFDIKPSADDSTAAMKWASEQTERFRTAENDSAYVSANSDAPFDSTFKGHGQLPPGVEDLLWNAPIGTVVGPFMDNGSYKLYKVTKTKEDSLYSMRASHILFRVENGDTAAAIKKANEVLGEIRKGASFEAKAAEYGSDGTKDRGGDLGWFAEGQMVKEFNDAVKRGNKGDLFYVKTQFGPHIVKVTDNKTRKKIQVASVEHAISASNATEQSAYAVAGKFAADSRDVEAFDKNAAAANLPKLVADPVKESDRSIPGVENSREIVHWAFNAKKGEVSSVFEIGEKLIVAILKEVREKEKANFDDVKMQVAEDAKKEKKAEMIIEKLTKALAEAKDPVAIALKLGSVANDAQNQTFENPNIPYMGMERTILGTAFGMKLNKLSEPLKGENGVYVIMVTKISEATLPKDLKQFRDEAMAPLRSRAEYEAPAGLKDEANVVDNRVQFF